MGNLAVTYIHQGKYSDAEILLKQCLDKSKVVLGESHHFTLTHMTNLAHSYDQQGQSNDAEVLYKKILDKEH